MGLNRGLLEYFLILFEEVINSGKNTKTIPQDSKAIGPMI